MWEVMSMLIRNSAEYINESAINSMIGLTPISEIVQNYNSLEYFLFIIVMTSYQRSSEVEVKDSKFIDFMGDSVLPS